VAVTVPVPLVLLKLTLVIGPVAEYERLYVSGQSPVLVTVKFRVLPFVFAVTVAGLPSGVTDTA
jgi:hypothetical protein